MAFIQIGGVDYSKYCNQLKITTNKKYNAQANAVGDTVIDYIKSKRTLEVGFIHMDTNSNFTWLLQRIQSGDSLFVKYRNPQTGALEQITCFVSDDTIDYYTIQDNKVQIKPFTLKFVEL